MIEDKRFSGHIVKMIKELRLESGWNQAELSRRADVLPATIWYIEKGKRLPSIPIAIKLAEAFKISVDELVNGEQVKSTVVESFYREFGEISKLDKRDKTLITKLAKRLLDE